MVQQLIHLLPNDLSPTALYALVGLAAAGVGVWLLAGQWSRYIVTLLLVGLGTIVGRNLPGWMGWDIDPMGPAIGGALLLGISGYVLHRTWVGIGLAALLATWAAVGCWVLFRDNASIDGTSAAWDGRPIDVARATWASLPPDLTQALPWACGTAVVVAGVLACLCPTVAVSILYSGVGVTMLVGLGLTAMHAARPQWVDLLPQKTWAQLTLVGAMLVAGTLVQWRLTKPTKSGGKSGGRRRAADDDDSVDALIGYKPKRA